MSGNAGSEKKPKNGFGESLKNFLNGKPRDPTAPLTSTKTYFKILIILIIVAVALVGVVFVVSYSAYTAETNPEVPVTPTVSSGAVATPVPTPIPTPVPTPVSSTVTKEAVSGEMQIVGAGNGAVSDTEKIVATERWIMNSTQYVQNGTETTYLTVYQYDIPTDLLIFVDKFALSNDTDAVVRIYPAGTYVILVSNDKSAELSNSAYSPYSAQLSTPTSGTLFEIAPDDSYISEDSVWEKAVTLNLGKGMWKYHEVKITVTPATAKQTGANGGWSTITIQYPWRFVWKITDADGTDDSDDITASTPYTNAEFILYDSDGSVVDTFGWKGFYSSKTTQNSKVYQPGEYTLAIYQRGCGISLEFQNTHGPVYAENLTVISEEGV